MNHTSIVKNSINSEFKIKYNSLSSYSVSNLNHSGKRLYASPFMSSSKDIKNGLRAMSSNINANALSTRIINTNFPIVKTIPETKGSILQNASFRYVRDHCTDGSTANSGNHWVGIEIINTVTGEKISENKPISSPMTFNKIENIVNGKFVINDYAWSDDKNPYVEIDLEEEYILQDCTLRVAHYPNRTYKNHFTEVSLDKKTWILVRDSKANEPYYEDGIGEAMNMFDGFEFLNPEIVLINYSTEPIYSEKQTSEISNINTIAGKGLKYEFLESYSLATRRETKDFLNAKPLTINIARPLKHLNYSSTGMIIENKEIVQVRREEGLGNMTFNIASDIPLEIGKTAKGEGLKNINLELQPLSYIKLSLDFGIKTVKSAKGLPPGLRIHNGYMEGSPTVSGTYNLVIILNDDSIINGKIKVNVLDRKI